MLLDVVRFAMIYGFFFICADAFEFHLECILTLHLLIERVWNLKLKSEQNETKTAAVDRHLKQ